MEEIAEQLNHFVHDKQHFTARYLEKLSQSTGVAVDHLAKGAVGFFALITLFHSSAHFVTNFLIVSTIILLTYIFRRERPNRDHLLVLWLIFGVMTLLDRQLENILFYYLIKVVLLLLLFLRPIRAVSATKARLFNLRIYTPGSEQEPISAADPSTKNLTAN